MDIPRGHAMLPLNESDFLDFIYNYFKAEYSPIRSFWSTAVAAPRHPGRWISMGHESQPLSIRPANAQAQKDLESLDYCVRKWNLDAGFVRGIVIRFAKYEVHERLEKKLFECARLDLMVRKALKEKHLIDALWPSPAPKNLSQDLLAQGVQVRRWYGDMFSKYFQVLHSVEDFKLRPEIDTRIKSSSTLMLVPFVDHLVFGGVDPIMPIVAQGDGYSKMKGRERRDGSKTESGFGEPGRFEIRFDAPAEVMETYTKSVVRQCQCMKCGTKRDVQVVVSVDPNPNADSGSVTRPPRTSGQDRSNSKTAQRYSPGYNMPGEQEVAPPQPPRPQSQIQETPRAGSPERLKQCSRCTFLNHSDLTACEMCQADLADATIPKPPSPVPPKKPSHSHSVSLPPQTTETKQENQVGGLRPAALNRHSLSSTLFSIFPFSQQQQQEHHAKLPPTQQTDTSSATRFDNQPAPKQEQRPSSSKSNRKVTFEQPPAEVESAPHHTPPPPIARESTPPLSQHPEMTMMPLTPPPSASHTRRPIPAGLPSNLMDDFVPVMPAFPREEEDAGAGWGEASREESRREESSDEEDGGALVDLDAVAREEMGVWGTKEDE